MKTKQTTIPDFKTESEEADWWASRAGRALVKAKSPDSEQKERSKGSPLVASLNKGSSSVQIALRLPEKDLAEARRIAASKGIGYQTLLKMILHEGLRREARRH